MTVRGSRSSTVMSAGLADVRAHRPFGRSCDMARPSDRATPPSRSSAWSGLMGTASGSSCGRRSWASARMPTASLGATGQSEPRARGIPARTRSRVRKPRSARSSPSLRDQLSLPSARVKSVQCVGCMLAVACDDTNTSSAASVIVSMCSIRCVAVRSPSPSIARTTKSIPASPIAWVVVGMPRRFSSVSASRYCSGSSHSDVVDSPRQSGSCSQAVPLSTVPSIMSLTPSTTHRRPCTPCSPANRDTSSSGAPGTYQGDIRNRIGRSRVASIVCSSSIASGARSCTCPEVKPARAM